MNAPFDHNEHMYITAGVLIKDGYALYRDFAYHQMPYLPLIYGAFYKLSGVDYYLLWGRIFSFLSTIVSCLLIFFIVHKISKSIFASTVLSLLLALNEVVLMPMAESSNYMMPMTFSLLGVYLFIVSVSEKRIRPFGIFLSGICAAIATCIKLYYAVTPFAFIVILFLYPKPLGYKKRITKVLLPFILGGMAGSVPAIYYILKDFDIFFFNNLGVHKINILWRESIGDTYTMNLPNKLDFGLKILKFITNSSLFAALLFLLFASFVDRKSLNESLKKLVEMESLLAIFLFLFTAASIFYLTPIWFQYFAMPIPYLLILTGCWYNALSSRRTYAVRILVISIVLLVSIIFGGNKLFSYIKKYKSIHEWTSVKIHNAAIQIRNTIGTVKKGEKIATLSPLYAIEAGLEIYLEFASGPFQYRVGDFITAKQRKGYVSTSQKTLHTFFEQDPPKAIIVGHEGDLDQPFIAYAQKNNYCMIRRYFDGGVLFVEK
jgi:hypothetical protein